MVNLKGAEKPGAEPLQRGRGRPRGRTEQGTATRRDLYEAALKLMAARGYEATTLRDIARKAGVSVGLLYRYFPSKRAVVLALYEELSLEYAAQVKRMKSGRWRDRFLFALRTSLDVLRPHREALGSLLPVLIGDGDEGLFAPSTGPSRERVQAVFQLATGEATDALPSRPDSEALGRVLYAAHLAILFWWLLDKSAGQRATAELVASLERVLPTVSLALRLRPGRKSLHLVDRLCREGLFGGDFAGGANASG